jgi:hypothetical protein
MPARTSFGADPVRLTTVVISGRMTGLDDQVNAPLQAVADFLRVVEVPLSPGSSRVEVSIGSSELGQQRLGNGVGRQCAGRSSCASGAGCAAAIPWCLPE